MAQAKASVRHKRGSTLTEMFKLAGDMVGDGMDMMLGKAPDLPPDDEWDEYSDDGTGTTGQGVMRELRKEFRRKDTDEDSYYSTTPSEEDRQERIRHIRQQEMDNIRRAKSLGDERELELKQKLSQFEEELNIQDSNLGEANPDFIFHGPTVSPKENKSPKNTDEWGQYSPRSPEQISQVLSGETNATGGDTTEYTEEPEEEEEEEEEEDDEEEEFASQIVHEMMQLLHHSRKNRNEAERLIEFKRTFIRQRHETNPDLDVYIVKNANYKKLECSARRFVRHIEDGDVPRTEKTLNMKKELLQNVAAMRDIRRESDELDREYERMFDAAE
eukprot:CAMPEP_0113634428 /NCGR_PEP_ID=MMETSP0017_2-20120614/17926_1 /TAXON_ID=2856 /ORGANISM="Cylindrotheca closterium" /LENGTH=329 /DNA_ID=CAMNT_0000545125 /DNA_START=37 /DNA_END=1026 /DNA_ORIENTATION=+ /assembly_acc=CAM_ASM_000147